MNKRWLSLLLVFGLVVSALIGCGASKTTAKLEKSKAVEMKGNSGKADFAVAEQPRTEETGAQAADMASQNIVAGEVAYDTNDTNGTGLTGSGSVGQTVSNAILAQRKVIRNANITVEVEDFEKAYGQVKSLVAPFGYIQESSIRKDKVHQSGKEKLITRGVIIVRVDKDKFESILSDIKGLGLLLDENIKSDDVTDKFFDVESRLRLLKFEQERLEAYLQKIDDPDIIFKTESRLTNIRHEIEGLTGTLNKWSGLVELSTITINMNEKGYDTIAAENKSYWNRLISGFKGSIKDVVVFFGELIIVAVQALPVIAILAALAFGGIFTYRKVRAKHMSKLKKEE